MSAFRDLMITGLPVYTVAFDFGEIPEQRIRKNKLVVKPVDPYREGYDFTGWFANDIQFDFSTPITSNLKLIAGWNLKTVIVRFEANGGKAIAPQVVAWGSKAAYVVPFRNYCNFTGWILNSVQFDFNTPITSDITLIARWERALITQTGVADVVLVWKSGELGPHFSYGARVNYPTPFTEISTVTVNGKIVPDATYDYGESGTYMHSSWKNNVGFMQTTGWLYSVLGAFNKKAGQQSGAVSWTATGYMS